MKNKKGIIVMVGFLLIPLIVPPLSKLMIELLVQTSLFVASGQAYYEYTQLVTIFLYINCCLALYVYYKD